MNCLTEALGLSLPGNGTIPATHANRRLLLEKAGVRIVEMAEAYYGNGDQSVLPRSIANRRAMLNAMTMDICIACLLWRSALWLLQASYRRHVPHLCL